ncbi:molybdate transport system ATP-binding protein [Microbacteriaceae bacterium SG_E_30_P1]|uniref:Molybdate transport system ATP-binding protein n=1 Tax=Antiquaquibacter oligotrophicus TaxID=2880260 RepID=A0ABT6KP06_9MICO|nr:ATP-binding cassette domain-containing protein [Antiquaquibacter oligotrophicus]MDH6181594.1 molybdate transport system ATP-binding protein [Antiquaquibacter oligotrophicus]UDF12720.1 ATP-binding cassette domain-containing protein [Antiquaquibacter oligotrophicus]
MTQRARALEATISVPRDAFTVEVELHVEPGEPLCIVGPNGAGKSTILGALAGTVHAHGSIRVGARDVITAPIEARRMGYVFQDYLLFPHLTVIENVAFGPRSRGVARDEARERASSWLQRFGVHDLAQRRPSELSGGQAQRVALARALAAEPDVLLLDEPLAALDVEVRDEVRSELRRHLREWGGIAVLVTHDAADVRSLAHDVMVLERGRVTQRGTLDGLRRHPATDYVRRLTGAQSE